MTGTWHGWIAVRPTKPIAWPRSVSVAKPSRSSMSVNTDIIGGGLPAARAATSSRTRAQSRTVSSALPRSLARSASPSPTDVTAGWAAIAAAASSPRAVSIRAVIGIRASEHGEGGVDVDRRLDLREAHGELARSPSASAPRSAASPALTRTSTSGGLVSSDASHSTTCWRAAVLVVSGDGVLEIEDHELGARRHRLGEALRPVARARTAR